MQCRKSQKYILQAVERSLAPALQSAVESHVAQCPACRKQWEFTAKTVTALRKAPAREVPGWVWTRIAGETANLPLGASVGKRTTGLKDWMAGIMEELSWGHKVAFSSALAGILALFVVWGSISGKSPASLPVIAISGSPVSAFPTYVREHYNPAGQPMSEGPMVLAFNTMGDNP